MYYTAERVMKKWIKEARLNEDIHYNINYDENTITIYTTRPGCLIGMRGHLIEKYNLIMRETWDSFAGFKFVETWGYVHHE